jgi:hypothetical protein
MGDVARYAKSRVDCTGCGVKAGTECKTATFPGQVCKARFKAAVRILDGQVPAPDSEVRVMRAWLVFQGARMHGIYLDEDLARSQARGVRGRLVPLAVAGEVEEFTSEDV